MHKFALVFIGMLLGGWTLLRGQSIHGRVFDVQTDEPLGYVNITYCEQVTTSDAEGYFELVIPDGKACEIRFLYVGYKPFVMDPLPKDNAELVVRLSPTDVLLKSAIVTGSKYKIPLEKSTVSIDVISPQFVKSQNATSIDEVLDKIPGVQIVDGQANIRGGSGWAYGAGSRVLLLLDDIPIMQPDAGFPHWNDLPLENIGQVEVLKGAASALYGSAAMNGIINVRTQYAKSDPEIEAGGLFRAYMSPPDSVEKWWGDTLKSEQSAYVAYRQKLGKLDLVLGGFYRSNNSFKEHTFSRYQRGNVRLRYRYSDKLNFGIYANANATEGQSYFYWDEAYSYRASTLTGLSHNKSLRYNIDPFVQYHDRWGSKHKLTGRYLSITNRSSDNRSTVSQMSYGEYQWHHPIESLGAHITAGIVGMRTGVRAELYNDTSYVSDNLAAYVQLDKQFGERFNLALGMRYEYNDVVFPSDLVGDTLHDGIIRERRPVWRLGMNYRLAKATHLRASWGQGYRFPTIAEQFIKTEAGFFRIIPNPYLHSETGWTAELGLKQGVQWRGWQGFVDVSAFWSRYQDMMEFSALIKDFQLYFQSQNVGNTVIRGIDANLLGRWSTQSWGLQLIAGYTFVDPRFQEYDSTGYGKPVVDQSLTLAQRNAANSSYKGNVLKYRNKHTAKMDAEFSYGPVFAGINLNYTSEVLAIDRVFELFIPGEVDFRQQNKGYTLMNVRFGTQYKAHRLTFELRNALNTIYQSRPGILEAPRSFVVKLDMKF